MLRSRGAKAALFLLCLIPAGVLGWHVWKGELTANPIEYITHFTGDWAIRLVVATLAITPLRRILQLPDLIRFRRMIGLFAIFYASLHFATWFGLDKNFDMHEILADFAKRRFITAGLAAFLAMVPLAVTSTKGWIRRLGGRNWQRLHRLIYLTAVSAVIHYLWLVKSDKRKPLMYGAMVAVLLIYRLGVWLWPRKAPAPTRAQSIRTATP